MAEKPKVCVIGAGLAGLTSMKCMLDTGCTFKCFEKEDHLGRRWHPNNNNTIPRSTVPNLSQYMSCYSDFPMPEKYPLCMSANQFLEYFDMYANHFNLGNHTLLNTEVVSVVPVNCSQDDSNMKLLSTTFPEKWTVAYRKEDEAIGKEEFDFVVACSGFNSIPYILEKFKAVQESFTGKIIHSIKYRDRKFFENQKVVVCDLGNTVVMCSCIQIKIILGVILNSLLKLRALCAKV